MRVGSPWLLALLLTSAPSVSTADVVVNEVMASNQTTVVPNAVAGTFDDWVELYNNGGTSADIGGWHLTDNATSLTKWTFPVNTVIPAGGYLVVLANNGGVPDSKGNLQTSFALNADGEYIGLVRPDLSVASDFGTGFPAMQPDISYGRNSGSSDLVFFTAPTPGAVNSAGSSAQVQAISASVKRGFFTLPFSVALSTPTTGSQIYYTLDGSPPLQTNGTAAAGALLYSAPIPVATSTVIRSAGVKAGSQPTRVDTQTYIFPAATATQVKPPGYSDFWGTGVTPDYEVDPQVSQSAEDGQRFLDGLRSIPVLTISTLPGNLFGLQGIYSNPQYDAEDAEAPVSAEYFKPAATGEGVNAEQGFQIDCGMRMQGGASRSPGNTKKHSFSLRFRSAYGPGKLNYDLFGASAVTSFNGVQLRAMYNNSWTHPGEDERGRATMIPDQFVRDSFIAMGQKDGGHGRFVHVFLNGLYWGVHNLHERPNDDHFVGYNAPDLEPEEVFGFNPGDYTTAERAAFEPVYVAASGGNWSQITQVMDVDSYVDYYMIQQFAHNDDLKANGNWRAAGGGPSNLPWRFYPWDSERTLENRANVNALAQTEDGVGIINLLNKLPDFQTRFADRVWKHLANGGALTNAFNRARLQARATEIDSAIVGESARWGDTRIGGGGAFGDYTRTANWLPAVYGSPSGRILGSGGWFPATGTSRTEIVLAAWRSQVWEGTAVTKIPSTDPPGFLVNGAAQQGGRIPAGGTLSITGGTGQIYFTTDGSDPRMPGGAVKPGLSPYVGGSISLAASAQVKVRWYNGNRWSALNDATFFLEPFVTAGDVRISEIHYHPADPSALESQAGAFESSDFQFVEVHNVSGHAVNLHGSKLANGVTFTFGNVPLAAGGRAVVVENAAAFALRYGNSIVPAGVWSGNLSGSGEQVTFLDPADAIITSVTYSDTGSWPTRPDGLGSSLEAKDAIGNPNEPANWRASVEFHGTPGTAGAGSDGRVLVNEVVSNPNAPLTDSIELVNTTGAPVNISGWFLTDGSSNFRKFRIPPGTVLPAGGYVVYNESHFNTASQRAINGYAGTAAVSPVTVTSPAHGLASGDAITISGYAGTGVYNGSFQVIVISADTFSIPVNFTDSHATRGTWTPGQPFGLSSSGEDVWLLEGAAGGEIRRFVDQVTFPASAKGQFFGRWPNASGPLGFEAALTLGSANTGPAAPTGFAAWASERGLPTGDPKTDTDGDGLPDLGEYVLDRNPRSADKPHSVIEGANLTLTYSRMTSRSDVVVTVEGSGNLGTWGPLTDVSLGTVAGMETRKVSIPLSGPIRFIRLRFTR